MTEPDVFHAPEGARRGATTATRTHPASARRSSARSAVMMFDGQPSVVAWFADGEGAPLTAEDCGALAALLERAAILAAGIRPAVAQDQPGQ